MINVDYLFNMGDEFYEFIELVNCFDFIGLIFKKGFLK